MWAWLCGGSEMTISKWIRRELNRMYMPQTVIIDSKETRLSPKYCMTTLRFDPATGGRSGEIRCSERTDKHYYSGVMMCKSAFACPICAPRIRALKAAELDVLVKAHVEAGGSWGFLTLTTSHSRDDVPADFLKRMKQAEGGFYRSRRVKEVLREAGFIESVKVWEYTFGQAFGWHPHSHQLMAFSGDVDLERLEYLLYPHWALYCEKRGINVPSKERGLTLLPGQKCSRYITKMGESGGAGLEMAGGGGKTAAIGHYQPFDLLDLVAVHGPEHWALKRWIEYCCFTKGSHFVSRYPKLKALYDLIDPPEWDGDEEDKEFSHWVASFGPDLFALIVQHKLHGEVLERFDSGEKAESVFAWVRKVAGW